MKIFVAASYSTQVNYETGEVFAEYKSWLEDVLSTIELSDHTVFCALREDQYKINDADPAKAFSLDLENIRQSDALIALLNDKPSTGVQTEIGIAVAFGKPVVLAHMLRSILWPILTLRCLRLALYGNLYCLWIQKTCNRHCDHNQLS